jgi:hypothetical protein
MKNTRRDDLDFDFDVRNEKKPNTSPSKVEYTIEPKSRNADRVRLGGITLDLSDDCLILRRRTRTIKEKTMIALDEIESTKVMKVTRPVLLFFAIFFLVFCSVGAVPLHLYVQNLYLTIGVAAAGVILFIIFLSCFLSTRRLQLIINFSSTRNIKYMIYETKMFETLNAFIDEVYHAKHQLNK